MNTAYFVSAYATSPSFHYWNPLAESQYFKALAENPEIIGIEHPFFINSEKYPLLWLLDNVPDHWSITLTALPAFMNEGKTNQFLGLASIQEKGRCQAVQLMEKVNQYTGALNKQFNRNIVKAIHFHSLPQNDNANSRGHKEALKRSLYEMQNLDWHGATLNLEHCDAYIPNQLGDKKLLLLEDELEVLTEVGNYGIVLNWARSAIEGRSALTPLQHIEMAKKAGLLRGFFFSGCTDNIKSDYGYWKDTHMPPKDFINGHYLRNDSLLGAYEIEQTLKKLVDSKHSVYRGVKVLDVSNSNEITKKIGLNLETINAINHVENNMQQSVNKCVLKNIKNDGRNKIDIYNNRQLTQGDR